MRRICLFLGTTLLTLALLRLALHHDRKEATLEITEPVEAAAEQRVFTPEGKDPFKDYTLERLNEPLDLALGYGELSHRLKLLDSLYEKEMKGAVFQILWSQLFRWILPNTNIVDRAKAGTQGIVMCVGNEFVSTAIHSLKVLSHLKSALPVVISHAGNFDLDKENKARIIQELSEAKFMNVCDYFDCIALDFDRWDSKPFALLASPFEETILMDADAIFVQKPEVLLTNTVYKDTFALFFRDRTLFGGNRYLTEWLRKMMPKPLSKAILESRIYRGLSNYEQESGVVVVNVKMHLFALLATCYLNTPGVREEMHAYMHGEKETFWMGFELVDHAYSYMPGLPGSIGRLETVQESRFHVEQICGHLAHFDQHGALLWFNDGLAVSKKESDDFGLNEAAILTHYGREGTWTDTLCIRGNLTDIPSALHSLLTAYRDVTGLNKRFVYNFETQMGDYQ